MDITTEQQTRNHDELLAAADRAIAAIESRDIDAVVAVYAPNGSQIHPFASEPVEGRDGIRASDGALLAAFPDVAIARRGTYVDAAGGRSVVVEVVLEATHTGALYLGDGEVLPATGRRIAVPSVWVLDVDGDGLITQERAYFDSAVFFRQLGLQE